MADRYDTSAALPVPPEGPVHPCSRVPLASIENSILIQAAAYWKRLSAGRRFPARTDVTPRELANLMRYTALLKVIDGGADYEYRVVGDAYVMAHGVSFQGKRWSDIGLFSPRFHRMVKPTYDSVVETGEPLATRGWISRASGSGEQIYSECIYLPLGKDETTVDHLLIFAVYTPHDTHDRSNLSA